MEVARIKMLGGSDGALIIWHAAAAEAVTVTGGSMTGRDLPK